MTRRVLIVGAGIAGLTLATALQRRGLQADVVEIKEDVAAQPGVGLSLQGNALLALSQLGLAQACLDAGVPANHINVRMADGTLVTNQTLAPMGGPTMPGTCGITRSTLHRILLDGATAAGARLRLGVTHASWREDAEGIEVQFTDGSQGRYDLMVGADGLYSPLRQQLLPEVQPTYCGQAVWRVAVPRPADCETTEVHFGGPWGVVGVCPISATDAYAYIVEAAAPGTRYAPDALAPTMVDKLQSYTSPLVQAGIPAMRASDSISFRPLEWLLIPERWHRGRTLLIGDAAHCGPPVLAQGAAMGIEDAVVLAELLDSPDALPAVFDRFMARRLPRVRLVVQNSVQLCEWEVNHSATPQEVGQLMRQTQLALCDPF